MCHFNLVAQLVSTAALAGTVSISAVIPSGTRILEQAPMRVNTQLSEGLELISSTRKNGEWIFVTKASQAGTYWLNGTIELFVCDGELCKRVKHLFNEELYEN